MNKWIKYYLFAALAVLALIFLLPLRLQHSAEDYWRTITILLPITVAVFIVPIASFTVNKWDIRFDFNECDNGIRLTISNLGIAPFNFNRISFASSRRFRFFSKKDHHPIDGMFGNDIECHGADMPSRVLHEHTGITIHKGMPISVWLRSDKIPDYLRHFNDQGRIHICLFYQGTNQKTYSQPIPVSSINPIY